MEDDVDAKHPQHGKVASLISAPSDGRLVLTEMLVICSLSVTLRTSICFDPTAGDELTKAENIIQMPFSTTGLRQRTHLDARRMQG